MTFTNGQRVRYTGTLVRRLIGQAGAFQEIGRHGWALVDFDRDGLVPVALDNLSPLVLTFAEFVASKKWTDTICADMAFDDGCEERGGWRYDNGGCYIEKSPNGQYRLVVERSEWVDADLSKLETILYAFHYVWEGSGAEVVKLADGDLDAFLQGWCAAKGLRCDGDLFGQLFSGQGPWTPAEAAAIVDRHGESLKAAKRAPVARFVAYRVKPVITTWPNGADPAEGGGTAVSFSSEADWQTQRDLFELQGRHHTAFWSIYGVDADGLEMCVGDFASKEGATEIMHAIYPKKPILAKVSVEAAEAVADFLDREAANNVNAATWAVERANLFGEVAEALHALANDTDAIVTDVNDL